MSENYLMHLAEWMNAQQINQSPRRRSKAAFLAVKDDVKAALDSEYSMHIVWKNMRDTERLSCSYKTFRLQVQRYIHQAVDEDDKDKGGDNADFEKSELSPPENKLQIENDEISGRMMLSVQFEENEKVKKLGAKWDVEKKSWYVPDGIDIGPFDKWVKRAKW